LYILNKEKRGKPTSETAVDNQKLIVFDEKVSLDEVIFGGRIINLVNDLARKVAANHVEIRCITVGIDSIRYFSPIKKSDNLICKAQVNHVWDDILEVGVKVEAEDFRTLEHRKVLSAYFIFKADPIEVFTFEVIPETLEEKRRYLDAEKRKTIREKKVSFSNLN
jgi:acyl-CoA hydrolase